MNPIKSKDLRNTFLFVEIFSFLAGGSNMVSRNLVSNCLRRPSELLLPTRRHTSTEQATDVVEEWRMDGALDMPSITMPQLCTIGTKCK